MRRIVYPWSLSTAQGPIEFGPKDDPWRPIHKDRAGAEASIEMFYRESAGVVFGVPLPEHGYLYPHSS